MLRTAKALIPALLLFAGCSHKPPAPLNPTLTAADTLMLTGEPTPSLTDLSGSWAVGSGPEPAVAIITLNPPCREHPAAWVIQQTGNALEAWSFPATFDQGIASRDMALSKIPSATGKISGLRVRLDGTAGHYVLQLDQKSGHLVGTLNGQQFWAVRQNAEPPGNCPGVP